MRYRIEKIDRYRKDKDATCQLCGNVLGEHMYSIQSTIDNQDHEDCCRECSILFAKKQTQRMKNGFHKEE